MQHLQDENPKEIYSELQAVSSQGPISFDLSEKFTGRIGCRSVKVKVIHSPKLMHFFYLHVPPSCGIFKFTEAMSFAWFHGNVFGFAKHHLSFVYKDVLSLLVFCSLHLTSIFAKTFLYRYHIFMYILGINHQSLLQLNSETLVQGSKSKRWKDFSLKNNLEMMI